MTQIPKHYKQILTDKKRIDVTQYHIDNSKRKCIESCVIANAILGGIQTDFVAVGGYCIRLTYNGRGKMLDIPEFLRDYINSFDKGKKVRPFTFYIDFTNNKITLE